MGLLAGRTGGGRFKGRNPIETWPAMAGYTGGEWKEGYSFGDTKAVLQ